MEPPGAPGVQVLGLDIGATKLAAGVVDSDGQVRSFVSTPTPTRWRDAVAALLALGRTAAADAGADLADLVAVGVGCGGPLDVRRGLIQTPPNLPDWTSVPILALVEEGLGRPTFVGNDADAAALATYWWGAHAGTPVLLYVTVSSGIGSGLVLDGSLYRGADDNGPELGHTVVDWQGRPCRCGQRGCAEAYVSGNSIGRRAQEAVASGWESSSLARPGVITAADVAHAARAGDPLGAMLWDESTAILGRVLASALNAFAPDLIVLGGGVTGAGAQLLEPVRKAALSQAMPPAAANGDVVLSAHGPAVGVLGAAAVAVAGAEGAGT